MKILTAYQEKVLNKIRESVARFQLFSSEDEYLRIKREESTYWNQLDDEYKAYLINFQKEEYNSLIKPLYENNGCPVETSVKPATFKALEDAGYIRRLRPSEKGELDMVQLLK
jgi:hypothetical protein